MNIYAPLEHLLHMASGLDCDDRDSSSAANEDRLWDNADSLDFYDHTLGVDVVHPPGTVAAYCSASANLAGGVIARAAGDTLLQLIDRLLHRCWLQDAGDGYLLTPEGEVSMANLDIDVMSLRSGRRPPSL